MFHVEPALTQQRDIGRRCVEILAQHDRRQFADIGGVGMETVAQQLDRTQIRRDLIMDAQQARDDLGRDDPHQIDLPDADVMSLINFRRDEIFRRLAHALVPARPCGRRSSRLAHHAPLPFLGALPDCISARRGQGVECDLLDRPCLSIRPGTAGTLRVHRARALISSRPSARLLHWAMTVRQRWGRARPAPTPAARRPRSPPPASRGRRSAAPASDRHRPE